MNPATEKATRFLETTKFDDFAVALATAKEHIAALVNIIERRSTGRTQYKKRYKFRLRKRLYEEQGGLCYWCKVEMVIYEMPAHEPGAYGDRPRMPDDYATFEHQHDHPTKKVVLACAKCNHERGRLAWQKRLEPETIIEA
jgi:hypothetical protein